MAKIRIVGDSSGYVELAAPNAAGNNTLELPSNATKLVGADASNSLNVTGIATFSSGIVVSAGSTSAPSISPSGDSNTGIFFPSADTVCIGEGGSEVIRVNSSGYVGVGTVSPSSMLHMLQSNGNAKITIQRSNAAANTDDYGSILWRSSAANNNGAIGVARESAENNGYMYFSTGSGGTLTERLRIDSNGHTLPGADNTYDLGASGTRWRNIYTADLQMSNEGSKNDVDGTWGKYTIQEGENDLFLINRRTGKRYKFLLEEVK